MMFLYRKHKSKNNKCSIKWSQKWNEIVDWPIDWKLIVERYLYLHYDELFPNEIDCDFYCALQFLEEDGQTELKNEMINMPFEAPSLFKKKKQKLKCRSNNCSKLLCAICNHSRIIDFYKTFTDGGSDVVYGEEYWEWHRKRIRRLFCDINFDDVVFPTKHCPWKPISSMANVKIRSIYYDDE